MYNRTCRRGDLNPHALAGTSPSSWRVCLFRHSDVATNSSPTRAPKARRTVPQTRPAPTETRLYKGPVRSAPSSGAGALSQPMAEAESPSPPRPRAVPPSLDFR